MAGLPTEIQDLDEFTESLNMVLYSDPGVGKTVFAGTCKCLFIATEPGTVAAARQGSKGKVWKAFTYAEFNRALEWVERNPNHGFDIVWIDSVTELQRLIIKDMMQKAVAENSKRDIDTPQIQDYPKWYGSFQRIIERCNSMPTNFGYVATAMHAENGDGDDLLLPMLSGKLGTKDPAAMSRWICASVAVIGYLVKIPARGKVKDAWQITFQEDPPITAKDRYDVLGRTVTTHAGGAWQFTMTDALKKIGASAEPKAPATLKKTAAPVRRRRPLASAS